MEIDRKWLIPLLLAGLVLAVVGYWGYGQYQEARQLQIYLGNQYQQSFYEMVDNVEQVQVLLGKALVAGTPQQNIMNLTDVWNKALEAQAELTNLPLSAAVVHRTSKFLSQTGDYAHVLASNNAKGRVLDEKNREQLWKLREQAASLSASLHKIESEVLDGQVTWSDIVSGPRRQLAKEEQEGFGNNFEDIQQDLEKYPTLIYDGPFSDHIAEMEPRGVTGEEISEAKARERAKDMADFADKNKIEVTSARTIKGRIPAYNFQIKKGDDNVYSVDISKKGGHLINILNSRAVNSSQIEFSEAKEKAQEYLARVGYSGMKPTYGEIKDNLAFISFAYQPEDITFYPDIINVQVALDNGQVMAVEALSYLISHQQRDPEEPEINEDEVEEMVETRLKKIEGMKLAVIPVSGLREVLTYEVKGTTNNDETYLIYINAHNGDEERIMQFIEEQDGTFTI